MKTIGAYIILALLLVTVTLTACNDVDDVLKASDKVYVTVMETKDTVNVVPGDTTSFKFMVTTNGGAVRQIRVEANEVMFEPLPEKMTFGLIDMSKDTLYADADGYLSRDVSTFVVDYPVVVKNTPEVLHRTETVTFIATSKDGKQGRNSIEFKATNFRRYQTSLSINNAWNPANASMVFMPEDYRVYRYDYIDNEVDEDIDEKRAKPAMIIDYVNDNSDPVLERQYPAVIYSADSQEAKDYLFSIGKWNYDNTKMTGCRIKHLTEINGMQVGGAHLTEQINNETNNTIKNQLKNERKSLDLDWVDKATDADLEAIDFSDAGVGYKGIGGLYAFQTANGRKGVFWISYPGVFGHNVLTIERMIIQAVASK